MLAGILARILIRLGQYAEGRELLDDVLSSAERVGAADIVAEAMIGKGQAYGFQGRMWEARALYGGARQLSEEINRPDLMASATQNLSFEVALDDPRLAVDLQRDTMELARRLGQRTLGITTLGNVAEDARRTGDWDWVLGEIDEVLTLQPEGSDVVPLRIAKQLLMAYRGEQDEAEIAALERALEEITDNDIRIGDIDIRGIVAFAAGRWADAAALWIEVAGISDLNQPYVLPAGGSRLRAGRGRRRCRGNARAAARPGNAGPGGGRGPGRHRGGDRRVAGRSGRSAGRVPHGRWRRGVASGCRGTRRSRPWRR